MDFLFSTQENLARKISSLRSFIYLFIHRHGHYFIIYITISLNEQTYAIIKFDYNSKIFDAGEAKGHIFKLFVVNQLGYM